MRPTWEGAQRRSAEILFSDVRKVGRMVDRTHRELTDEVVARIANTYHAWRACPSSSRPHVGEGRGERYADVPGFCKSATLVEVRKHGFTPGRYGGSEAQKDDGKPFEEKMKPLAAQLREQ